VFACRSPPLRFGIAEPSAHHPHHPTTHITARNHPMDDHYTQGDIASIMEQLDFTPQQIEE
jgi:hypothetical protein